MFGRFINHREDKGVFCLSESASCVWGCWSGKTLGGVRLEEKPLGFVQGRQELSFALGEGDSPLGGRKRNLSVLVLTLPDVSLSDFGATTVPRSSFIPNVFML